jgi:hypothetical protein
MRRSAVYAAAGLAGSMVIAGAVVAFPSSAYTAKELNMCWVNHSKDSSIDLEAVADGPSYKTTTLDSGQCRQYDVRAGQYKITVEDVQEFLDDINAASTCPGAPSPKITITVKRMNEGYRAFPLAAFLNGSITTNVKKDRRTSITALLNCA